VFLHPTFGNSKMKTLLLNTFLFINIAVVSSTTLAGSVSNAKITQIYCGYYDGANMCSIYFDKALSDSPTCHTKSRKRMQIKTDDDTGKAILSLALTAYSTQNIVDAGGKNTCTVWPDTEDMNVITIKH
jgi:hypothetical protein